MVHATAHKRNTEKFSYTTARDFCDQFGEERSSLRRREPRAGAAQQSSVLVCGQLALSGEPGIRDPPPSPCSAYVLVLCTVMWWGDPKVVGRCGH